MSEDEARQWLGDRFAAREREMLDRFVDLLIAGTDTQNLIARSTVGKIWSRHIVDSAQLVDDVPNDGHWVDIGSGGGLPGIVIAILRQGPISLVEPRRKRAEFLRQVVGQLALPHAIVAERRAQSFSTLAGIISARAVASLDDLFAWTEPYVSRETTYLLPRGRHWQQDVSTVKSVWNAMFHVKQSVTDETSMIVHASQVARK